VQQNTRRAPLLGGRTPRRAQRGCSQPAPGDKRRFRGDSAWEARRHLSENKMIRASFCENDDDICAGCSEMDLAHGAWARTWRCAVERWSGRTCLDERRIGHVHKWRSEEIERKKSHLLNMGSFDFGAPRSDRRPLQDTASCDCLMKRRESDEMLP
jgi:hypothetical protein